MKALCDGSLELDVEGFESLAKRRASRVFDEMQRGLGSKVPGSSMNRFWFTPGEQQFMVDEGISVIAGSSVALETEQQMLTAQGTMASTAGTDEEAEQWAEDFTERYRQIAETEGSGIYLQLHQLFDHVAIAKLLVRESNESGLPNIEVLLDGLRIPAAGVPSELEGRGNLIALRHTSETTRQILTRTASLQLCGGVGIQIDVTEERITRNAPGMHALRTVVVESRPGHNRLWWDVTDSRGIAA